jgi:hypothetical protein
MKQFQINSFDAVNDFLSEIYYTSGKVFDPAEDIRNLKDKKGDLLFTKDESEYLDGIMMQCFIFCLLNDLNIYTLATMVKYDLYHAAA